MCRRAADATATDDDAVCNVCGGTGFPGSRSDGMWTVGAFACPTVSGTVPAVALARRACWLPLSLKHCGQPGADSCSVSCRLSFPWRRLPPAMQLAIVCGSGSIVAALACDQHAIEMHYDAHFLRLMPNLARCCCRKRACVLPVFSLSAVVFFCRWGQMRALLTGQLNPFKVTTAWPLPQMLCQLAFSCRNRLVHCLPQFRVDVAKMLLVMWPRQDRSREDQLTMAQAMLFLGDS